MKKEPPREEVWTGPCNPDRTWCRNLAYWTAWDDEATELEVTELVAALVRATQPELAVETGAYTGQTTYAIGKALVKNGHGHLIATETDAKRYTKASRRCKNLPVTVVHGTLADCPLIGSQIDFAFIDAGADRIAEITPRLGQFSSGAILVVHDVAPHHEVWKDVVPLIADGCLTAVRLRTPRGVAIAQVP